MDNYIMYVHNIWTSTYRKQGKIRWAKFSHFQFSGVPQKFLCEYKHLSLIILNNEYLWPRQCKNISVKTLMALKPQIFSPANLSLSMVCHTILWNVMSWHVVCHDYRGIPNLKLPVVIDFIKRMSTSSADFQ